MAVVAWWAVGRLEELPVYRLDTSTVYCIVRCMLAGPACACYGLDLLPAQE